MIYLCYSGWTRNSGVCVFVESSDETTAEAEALLLFQQEDPGKTYHVRAEPLRLGVITECEGW